MSLSVIVVPSCLFNEISNGSYLVVGAIQEILRDCNTHFDYRMEKKESTSKEGTRATMRMGLERPAVIIDIGRRMLK